MPIPFEQSYHGLLRQHLGKQKVIVPAARAVIQNDTSAVLFVRRSDNHEWGMPAGAIELGESIYDCMAREVWEETGLRVESAVLIAIYSGPRYDFTNSYGGEHQMLAFVFRVDAWSGQLLSTTDETVDARFFPLDALPDDLPSLYRETLADVQAFAGQVIVK
jgi:8-oxo-dGTP pyrophosphatase MutT (NUDIX family)